MENDKSLEQLFEEATLSDEEMAEAQGGALLLTRDAATRVINASTLTRERLSIADLTAHFDKGLGDIGYVLRPDRDVGH